MNFTKRLFFKANSFNNLKETKIIKRKKSKSISVNKLSFQVPYAQEEHLFSNKSNIEIILGQIKAIQESFLLQEKTRTKITTNEKKIFYKKLLYDLKKNLTYMLFEKNTKEIYLQNKLNENKKLIQNKLFNLNNQKQNTNDNKEFFIEETEVLEKNYGGNELSKLKMLNFQVENEIQKLDFLIQNKTYMNNYLKMTGINLEENIELFYDHHKRNSKEIDDSFNFHINEAKNFLNLLIAEKKEQNKEINQIKKDIAEFKENLEFEKIKPTSIILEVSEENKDISHLSNIYNSFIDNNFILNNSNNLDSLNENNKEKNKIVLIEEKKKVIDNKNKTIRNNFNISTNINFGIKIYKNISKMINNSSRKRKINNYVFDNNKKYEEKYLNKNENKENNFKNTKRRLSEVEIIIH